MKKEKFNRRLITFCLGLGGISLLLGIFLKIEILKYIGNGLLVGGMIIGLMEFFRLEILKEK